MAPALAVVWLAAAAPPGPGVREAFVAAVLSVLVVAAAARSEGLHTDTTTLRLAFHRAPSHSANLLLLLVFLSLAAGVGGTIGGMIGDAAGLPVDLTGTTTAFVFSFPVLAWYWPLTALAVVAPEETGRRPGGSAWLWWGPGYTSARRLSRGFGSATATGSILIAAYVWLGLVLAADAYRGEDPFPTIVEIASYALFLPLLAWMCVVEVGRLTRSALGGS